MRFARQNEILGSLCKRNHDHQGTGMSLRFSTGHCIECVHLRYAERMAIPEKRIKYRKTKNEINKRNSVARKEQSNKYYQKNRDAINKSLREKRSANLDLAKKLEAEKRDRNREAIRLSSKKSKAKLRADRADDVRKYARENYKRNSIAIRIRNRVSKALRHQCVKKQFSVEGYGVNIEAIAQHIGPCPGNPSDWHIDHIRPLASFDFSDVSQIAIAFKPENHQWLPAKENLIKHCKYDPLCTKN